MTANNQPMTAPVGGPVVLGREAVSPIAGRRRRQDNAGEPLFGEDWWAADQELFEDSLIRQESRPVAPRRRSRRPGSIRKRTQPAQPGLVQDMLPGFQDDQGAADGEPVRGDGPQALGAVAAGPVRGDPGPGEVLRGLGDQAEEKIGALAWELAGDDPPGEGYLAKAGRLGEARHRAEQIVLDEMILLPPEPGAAGQQPATSAASGQAAKMTWPRRARSAGSARTSQPCRCCAPASGKAGRRRPPSRKCWPAGRGGVRCRRSSMTAGTSSPGRASSSPACCHRLSWRPRGGTR